MLLDNGFVSDGWMAFYVSYFTADQTVGVRCCMHTWIWYIAYYRSEAAVFDSHVPGTAQAFATGHEFELHK